MVPAATNPWGRPFGWRSTAQGDTSHREELPVGSVRPQRWALRVLGGDEQLRPHAREPLAVSCGRGNHEKTIAQLKSGLAFHTVPTLTYAANSAWQQLVVLTHNLLTNFQIETGPSSAAARANTPHLRALRPCRRCASRSFTARHSCCARREGRSCAWRRTQRRRTCSCASTGSCPVRPNFLSDQG